MAQNEPLPGLSMIDSPGSGTSSGMISQPGSPRTRMRPHGAGIANPHANPPRTPALVFREIRKVRPVALASVQDMKSAAPHRCKHPRNRRDRRAGQRQIVSHPVDIAADTTEIDLHIDYDESRILPQVPIERPGIRVGRDIPFGHGAIHLLTLDPDYFKCCANECGA